MDQRSRREAIPQQVVGLPLREEERKVLAEVGRFRVVTTRDLSETVYDNRHSRMERDLAFLREKGLVQVDAVNARRDGRGGRVERIEVVTLTRAGRDVARQTSGLAQDQKLYAGLVKPREAEHDAQIYRAYRKEAERIEQKGGTNLRVRLDFELKSDVQKAIHAARRAEPERDMGEIKQQVAQQVELPYVNDGIQIPDARIEYDMDQGSRTGHEDIEVLTAAYRPGHLRNKAQAGFHNYASSSDRATLSAKIEDDQHLMENILEL
jgi:DNA-binding transcriptional ArsR family regulator